MANIKFSQFTVGNTESDIDFVVGYKGANNIQISPANLLSATLTGYLPLTGGTMTGDIVFNDNVKGTFGSSQDLEIFHNGTDSSIRNFEGDLIIRNADADKDILFQADDGSGGVTDYFRLDGSTTSMRASKNITFIDGIRATFGSGADMFIYHNGTTNNIESINAKLRLIQTKNDSDISFESDDGSGGITEYFRVDGSTEDIRFSKKTRHFDNVRAEFGDGGEFDIYYDGSNAFLVNGGSAADDIQIINNTDDGDIKFFSDDGTGSTTEYFRLDGSVSYTVASKAFRFLDTVNVQLGNSADFTMQHNATNTELVNVTGNLNIKNTATNGDITFFADDGGGGATTYFKLDGSARDVVFSKDIYLNDDIRVRAGTGGDFSFFHDGSNSKINNNTGNIVVENFQDDGDIIFKCDDGSGGTTEYFKLDGSSSTAFNQYTVWPDASVIAIGTSKDLQLYHNGSTSYIYNNTGNLDIFNAANDKDIRFFNDDGSGGVTEYFRLDGDTLDARFSKNVLLFDNVQLRIGASSDLQILHDASDSFLINNTGDLYIRNNTDDKDIIFQCDDGSGGVTNYMFLDGSTTLVQFYKSTKHSDNIKANFGNSNDLEIYHSGSHGFINGSNGAGSLYLRPGTGGTIQLETPAGVDMINASATDVRMYASGNERVRVKNIGINIQNVPTYADNTAAIAGGLTTGDVYRTGDLLKIVH